MTDEDKKMMLWIHSDDWKFSTPFTLFALAANVVSLTLWLQDRPLPTFLSVGLLVGLLLWGAMTLHNLRVARRYRALRLNELGTPKTTSNAPRSFRPPSRRRDETD